MPAEQPKVVCVMLTRGDRPAMEARAIRGFDSQTYQNKELLIFDTSDVDGTIGALRNLANARADGEIIAHLDNDDLSHTYRLAEQVALLQASGADCVGYRELLFWREGAIREDPGIFPYRGPGEAWIYRNHRPEYAVGTSLMYWRKTWERKPFKSIPHTQTGSREDSLFCQNLKMATVSCFATKSLTEQLTGINSPRMIASIHDGNLNPYNPEASPSTWRRAPEFDSYCRERMAL